MKIFSLLKGRHETVCHHCGKEQTGLIQDRSGIHAVAPVDAL